MTTTNTRTDTATARRDIGNALYAFINQRPGTDARNYGDWPSYRQETAEIGRQRNDALTLLAAVDMSSITAEAMAAELCSSGRLTWNAETRTLSYCTGQYFPTEFRRAAARALASMLWTYYRDHCECDTADKIRAAARRSFRSRRIRAYFN